MSPGIQWCIFLCTWAKTLKIRVLLYDVTNTRDVVEINLVLGLNK